MEFKRDPVPSTFAFELSNRCNLAAKHPECPTQAGIAPVFLSTDIIKDALRYLGSVGVSGPLYFNIYNEPLIDPRLFMLIEYAKEHCGTAGVCIYTNGWGLDQHIADELVKLNVYIVMSCYTPAAHKRGVEMVSVHESAIKLDPLVKTIYDSPPTRTGPCRFPSVYGAINHKGELALCCRDYEYRHTFGDLKTNTLEELIMSEYRNSICDQLEIGTRSLETCQRCPFPGWGVPDED